MESQFLAWLRARLPADDRLPLGLHDDAAELRLPHGSCVLSSDLLTDRVHFDLSTCDPRRVGRKALAVNLSDLAAMACEPRASLVSLALPRDHGQSLAEHLFEGLLPLAEQFGCPVAGGDTNSWDGPLVISVTVVGIPLSQGPLRRSGGKVGDWIVVTGSFGGSILGKQFDFVPRVAEAQQLHADFELHAGTDVSDGLLRDLAHITEASGCGAMLDLPAIPLSDDAARTAEADGRSALQHALTDGEDFELILAVPPAAARRMLAEQPLATPLSCIGRLVEEPGLWENRTPPRRLLPRGYEH